MKQWYCNGYFNRKLLKIFNNLSKEINLSKQMNLIERKRWKRGFEIIRAKVLFLINTNDYLLISEFNIFVLNLMRLIKRKIKYYKKNNYSNEFTSQKIYNSLETLLKK